MAKLNFRVTPKEKAFFEHYVYSFVAAGVGLYQAGQHNWKKLLAATIVAVIAPVLARLNPNSIANKVSNETGLPESTVAPIVTKLVTASQEQLNKLSDTPTTK